MTLNELRDEAFAYAEKQGFHETPFNLGESLMLIVSELSEALEADRNFRHCRNLNLFEGVWHPDEPFDHWGEVAYYNKVKGTVEEEIADSFIRLFHLAARLDMDLDWHVRAKMAYNKTRPYKHGKEY
jgi:NTP pyrophosphatase (non-canonical NTP hydrolase)